MTSIVLHGELKEKFRDQYDLDVQSPREAVRALCSLVPNFKNTLSVGNYFVYVQTKDEIYECDEETLSINLPGEIHIVPEIIGAKKGLGKIVAGLTLIAASLFLGPSIFSTILFNVGVTLTLQGASMMLAPKVKPSPSEERQESYITDGSDLNIQNGQVVPVIYGEVLADGFPISIDISDSEVNVVTEDTDFNLQVGSWTKTAYQIYENMP
jgi:predicted phage tail protein